MKNLKTVLLIALLSFSLSVPAVFAQSRPNIQGNLGNFGNAAFGTTTTRPLPVIIGSILGAFLSILGIIIVVYMFFGGYTWMTAQGDEGKVTEAKNILRNAIIGLIIILLSYVIADFVTNALVQATSDTTSINQTIVPQLQNTPTNVFTPGSSGGTSPAP